MLRTFPWAYGKEKIRKEKKENKFARFFRIVPALSKKIFRRNFPKLLSTGGGGWVGGVITKIPIRWHISHKIDRISHKIDRICPIYFYNKPILPDCEANIAQTDFVCPTCFNCFLSVFICIDNTERN